MSELKLSSLWRCGLDWLNGSLSQTIADDLPEMREECSKELKTSIKKIYNLTTTEGKCTIGDVMQCERFSGFRRLVRVTAYVVRAVKLFKSKRTGQGSSSLSTEELADAERRWIEDSQENLKCEKTFESLRSQPNLFLDKNRL